MKLNIELVPSSSWYNNLRNVLRPAGWEKIRVQVLARANGKCEICGSRSKKLECHEKWEYNDETKVQSLSDIHALCYRCHRIKHFGLSLIQSSKGIVNINTLEDHFMRVNECSYAEFEEHVSESFRIYGERSREEWQIDISAAARYLEE